MNLLLLLKNAYIYINDERLKTNLKKQEGLALLIIIILVHYYVINLKKNTKRILGTGIKLIIIITRTIVK